MKKRLLVCVLSLFLVVGFSLPVSAAWVDDSTTDSELQPYDIKRAKVETYPADAGNYDEYLFVCMEMKAGGKLPGAILVALDVDGNTSTGGGGMFYFMSTCQSQAASPPGAPIRSKYQGVDISINIILDDQDGPCATDWNSGNYGAGDQCFLKNTPCDAVCDKGPGCWLGATSCSAFDIPFNSDCYKAGDMCDLPEPTCDSCFEMPDPCLYDVLISYPKDRGEWFANILDPPHMSEPYYGRGKIDTPLPAQGGPGGSETAVCFTLPYKQILTGLKAGGSTFIESAAKDSGNIVWVMTAWEDNSAGGCDYIQVTPQCTHVVDAVPDTGAGSGQDITAHVELCRGETTLDGIVSAPDLDVYEAGYYEYGCEPEYVQGPY